MAHYILFTTTALIAVSIPGPDFLLVLRTSLRNGKREAVFSAIGIGAGLIVHGTAATFGLSALLLKSARAFEIVKWIGASYLIFLAIQLSVDLFKNKNIEEPENTKAIKTYSAKKYILRGFLTNVLNVKAALYFVAIVPQFVVGQKNIGPQLIALSIIQVVVAIIWFSILAISVNKLGGFLKRRIVQRWLDGASATIFLGLAYKLTSTSRS